MTSPRRCPISCRDRGVCGTPRPRSRRILPPLHRSDRHAPRRGVSVSRRGIAHHSGRLLRPGQSSQDLASCVQSHRPDRPDRIVSVDAGSGALASVVWRQERKNGKTTLAKTGSNVPTAAAYYDSADTAAFYRLCWGGSDIHIGHYATGRESVADASAAMARAAGFGIEHAEERPADIETHYTRLSDALSSRRRASQRPRRKGSLPASATGARPSQAGM